jgi:seryl-tRNA synthetase
MLNATLCATGRAICCLLETYQASEIWLQLWYNILVTHFASGYCICVVQEADGVRIPEVLVPYMGGLTFLPFVRDSKLPDKVSK